MTDFKTYYKMLVLQRFFLLWKPFTVKCRSFEIFATQKGNGLALANILQLYKCQT